MTTKHLLTVTTGCALGVAIAIGPVAVLGQQDNRAFGFLAGLIFSIASGRIAVNLIKP